MWAFEREIVASINFSGRDPSYSDSGNRGAGLSSREQATNAPGNNLDWHILLVSSQQSDLLDILQRNRGSVLYQSKEAVIFSIASQRIEALAKEIQSTGGIFADFGDTDFGIVSLLGVANIMVYFSEQ